VAAACNSPRGDEASKGGEPSGRAATESVEITPASGDEIRRAIRVSGARATVVNVWATWCLPCREEFPDLMRLYRTYRDSGVALVLVSADFEDQLDAARQFLIEQGVDFPSFFKGGKDAEFIDALDPRWSGALPATWIYDADGVIRHFREGKTTFQALEQKLLRVLR
jgi:thiol-disulfide isomerase/thioredoxin